MADLTGTQQNAWDYLKGLLAQYGIDSPELVQVAQNAAINGMDETMFMQQVRGSNTYKQRFPAMEARRKAGYAPITEQDYVNWESTSKTLMRNAGLPTGFYDSPDDFTKFISGDVSPSELKSRIEDGVVAAQNATPEVKAALASYGVDQGHLASFFLDPTAGTDAIMRKLATAQIGGAALQSGFGALSEQEAGGLLSAGVSAAQAQQRLGALTQGQQLLTALPGEAGTTDVSREEQLQFAEGAAGAQADIERRARQRAAQFQGGGGMAAGQQGVVGLGGGGA